MITPKSAENIRKLELSLDELVPKFQDRLQLIRDDLRSLINNIENLKNFIGENRRKSNDYTREISDLTNDLQTINDEIGQIEREIKTFQNKIDIINNQISELQADLMADKNKLDTLKTEKSTLTNNLQSLDTELTSLKNTYEETKPKFDSQMKTLEEEFNRRKAIKDSLGNKFQATRTLCYENYLQSPEVGLLKFLAMKPSPLSTLTEIKSALGIDSKTLNRVLKGLADRKVLEFDETAENINLLAKIDLFDKEV